MPAPTRPPLPGPQSPVAAPGVPPASTAELAELFTHTARRLRRGSSAQLAPLGITYGQARALRLVAEGRTPLRMADLAAQLEVVPRSATTMVDALEAAGLVARRADAGDRRSVLVSLTGEGRRLLERLEHARRRSAEEVFGSLGAGQRAELLDLLHALCERAGCGPCCLRGAARDPGPDTAPAPGGAP